MRLQQNENQEAVRRMTHTRTQDTRHTERIINGNMDKLCCFASDSSFDVNYVIKLEKKTSSSQISE